jgi:hypothetical protein
MRSLRLLSLLGIAATACSAPSPAPEERVIDIVALDYAFQVPDTVRPGPALLRLTNHGAVAHEVIVMKLRPGVSVEQLFAAQQHDESFRPSLDGGVAVLFANPGTTGDGRLTVNFEAGHDYALWCNFQDGNEAPLHSALGMFKQIHVAGPNDELAITSARRLVVDANDYAFRVADTLPAGVTDFVLTNSGQQRHEISFARMPAGVSPAVFFDEYLKGNDVDSLYDDDGAVLTAYGGESNEFAVRIDLLAGRSYVLICELRDTPDAPPHVKLGMFKGIEVR